MKLCIKGFNELTTRELYEILKLRSCVFVVEQKCIYQDLDDRDQEATHIWLEDEDGIQAYLRLMESREERGDVIIGRVIAAKRRCGLGTQVLRAAIDAAAKMPHVCRIVLDAQVYARRFYEKQGFVQSSEEFLEDGIPHIRMTLELDEKREGLKLFLTSSPCDDDVPEDVDLPCIFFERNRFVENLSRCVPPDAKLLVIAADPNDFALNDEMTQTFAGCFEYHGMELSEVELLDARTEEFAAEMVADSDVILLGGGHVPTQSAFFNRIGLRVLLDGYNGVVIGISAGSMNCASIVYAQPECPGESLDPYYRRFIPGLALTDTMILPHYQKVRDYILDGKRLYEDITYADSIGRHFIAMPDGSYILSENGCTRLFGEGYMISNGQIRRICEEENSVEI